MKKARKLAAMVLLALPSVALAVPPEHAPVDALDETKVGVAAEFISISAGEFEMGSPQDEADRYKGEIQHLVKLTKDFEMQATEVTQLQYFLVMGSNPSYYRKQQACDKDNYKALSVIDLCVNHPVERVSWNDAQEFIKKLNRIQDKYTYRLPTEAEWEYAARAGNPFAYPYSTFRSNDSRELDNYAWYHENSNLRTHAVAMKKSNPLGLYDMFGNVEEWIQDFYRDYPIYGGDVADPTGPQEGSRRVVRGLSCYDPGRYLRFAARDNDDPDKRESNLGFRLARSPR